MNLCRLTHDIPIFYKMIPNGHATFKLCQRILIAALRLHLRRRVFGLLGRRTSLDQSMRMPMMRVRWRLRMRVRRMRMGMLVLQMLLLLMMMVAAAAGVAIRIELTIPLLPLHLMIFQATVASRRDRDSCRRAACCGGMMIALMMVMRLPRAAAFHRVAAVLLLLLMLQLVGIEAETILIIGMRCHLVAVAAVLS